MLVAKDDAHTARCLKLCWNCTGALFDDRLFWRDRLCHLIAWARVYQSWRAGAAVYPDRPEDDSLAQHAGGEARSTPRRSSTMMRNIGGSFCSISAVTTLIARSRTISPVNVLIAHVTAAQPPLRDGNRHASAGVYLGYTASAADALRQAEAQVYATVQQQAALLSFNDCFWAMAVILAAMVPVVLLMRKPSPGAASSLGY